MSQALFKEKGQPNTIARLTGVLAALVVLIFSPVTENVNLIKELLWWCGLSFLLGLAFLTRTIPYCVLPLRIIRSWNKTSRLTLFMLLAYTSLSGLCLLYTPDSVVGTVTFLRQIGYVITFIFIALLVRNISSAAFIILPVLLSAVLSSLYALAQFAGLDVIPWKDFDRPVGTLGNPNFLAGFLIAILPLLAIYELSGKKMFNKIPKLQLAFKLQLIRLIRNMSWGRYDSKINEGYDSNSNNFVCYVCCAFADGVWGN